MMQKMVDLVERASFSSPTILPSATLSTASLRATSSSSTIIEPVSSSSSSESSSSTSPLSPTTVEEGILTRTGGTSGRAGSPFPFSSVMSVSPDPKTPAQFLLGLGIQILEGRLPNHKQAKGFVEGDHCTSLFKSVSHFCDFETNPLCRQLASLQFLLMPDPSNLSLEVVLTPSKHSNNTTNEYNNSSNNSQSPASIANNLNVPNEMLIEKWRITMIPLEENEAESVAGNKSGLAGAPPIMMTPRNLHNAVRSFLHFSQLAAWLSKKKEFTSAWKVRIDMADNGAATTGITKDGWDTHEFPAVILESQSFWETQHRNIHLNHQQRGWGKGRINSKWIVKVTVDSLPRMKNFPLLPVPSHIPCATNATSLNNSITANNTKPCLSSSHSSSTAATTCTAATTATTNHNKSQQIMYGDGDGLMMLGENEVEGETGSGVRIRFRGGRSRRSHTSGGNGSSSHRRPKNLRIAIPDGNQSGEEDVEDGGGGFFNSPIISATSAVMNATILKNQMMFSRDELLLTEIQSHHHNLHLQHHQQNSKIPSLREKLQFETSLNRATSQVFHKSGLPLTSSPAPIRRCGLSNSGISTAARRFDFDSSLLPKCSRGRAMGCHHFHGQRLSEPSQSLLGSFEESVLNGRIEPVSTVEGFTAEVDVGSSHNFRLPVTVFFYTFCDNDRVSSPYSAHVTLSPTVYPVPRSGTVQVTLYNPMKTVVKMFVINYDLSSMPPNSQTFIRQKILFMPLGKSDRDLNARKWLRYLIHLRFASSGNGDQIFLHKDIRMIVLQKSDADTAVGLSSVTSCNEVGHHDKEEDTSIPYELRSFTYFAHAPPCKQLA